MGLEINSNRVRAIGFCVCLSSLSGFTTVSDEHRQLVKGIPCRRVHFPTEGAISWRQTPQSERCMTRRRGKSWSDLHFEKFILKVLQQRVPWLIHRPRALDGTVQRGSVSLADWPFTQTGMLPDFKGNSAVNDDLFDVTWRACSKTRDDPITATGRYSFSVEWAMRELCRGVVIDFTLKSIQPFGRLI